MSHADARTPVPAGELTIVPANEASWADLRAVFGTSDYPGKCYCQRFKTRGWLWGLVPGLLVALLITFFDGLLGWGLVTALEALGL